MHTASKPAAERSTPKKRRVTSNINTQMTREELMGLDAVAFSRGFNRSQMVRVAVHEALVRDLNAKVTPDGK